MITYLQAWLRSECGDVLIFDVVFQLIKCGQNIVPNDGLGLTAKVGYLALARNLHWTIA